MPKRRRPKWVYLEEYRGCGCTNVTVARRDAVGYCPKHLTDRRRIAKMPGTLTLGYAGTG
jgi:hypothetical protein